jgi:hypothetical protein
MDLAATFLDLFSVAAPDEMEGRSLLPVVDADHALRDGALYGYFGGAVNVTGGRYTYHRFPPDLRTQEIYQYTLMPTHIFEPFSTGELAAATLAPPFPFSKGVPLLKVPVTERSPMFDVYGPGALLEDETRLYDLAADPGQERPLRDAAAEARMATLMRRLMQTNGAPGEAFTRLGL